MHTNGAPNQPPSPRGHVLLLAGAATGKRRTTHRPAANLAALAAARPPALLGSSVAADVVQLLDESEPQALLTRLRTAAATPGPLAVYLSGQLTVDRRQHQLHLTLARTTALTVRYTALPWWWLGHELRDRSWSDTAVFADLTADDAAWRILSADPSPLSERLPLYGVVAPPRTPVDGAATAYTRHLAEQLRSGGDPRPAAELHQYAAAAGSLDGAALWYSPEPHGAPAAGRVAAPAVPAPAPPQPPAPPLFPASAPHPPPGPPPETPASRPATAAAPRAPDPHQDIWRAVQAGRHTEAAAMAAAWEEHALRTTGPDSEQSRHWLEIRADLARRAGDHVRATELCVAIALACLRQSPQDTRQVGTAVDNAHHCWERVTDPVVARRLAPALIDLRRAAPGPGDRLLRAAQRRLAHLQGTGTAPGASAGGAASGESRTGTEGDVRPSSPATA